MEDNFNNYQNEDNSFNQRDDDQSGDNMNINLKEDYQNFERNQIEDEDINKNNNNNKETSEYINYLDNNNKNSSLGLNSGANYNENEMISFSQQDNQYNNRQIPFMNTDILTQNYNPNEIMNIPPQYNQKKNKYYKNNTNMYLDNLTTNFSSNPNEKMNLTSQYIPNNIIMQNKIRNFGNFNPNFNKKQNKLSNYPPYYNQQYNNMENQSQNMNQNNFRPNFNYIPNEISNFFSSYDQNNQYNNIQNPFSNQENNLQAFIDRKIEPLNKSLNYIIWYLNQLTNQYSFQNNSLHNMNNSENNNNNNFFISKFQNLGNQFKQSLPNLRKNDNNYSNFNRSKSISTQNKNINKNLNNISYNNQIKNEIIIQKRKNNENKFQNNKSIKDFNINELLDINVLKLIPDMNEFIKAKIKKINYNLNDEDIKILNNNNYDKNKTIFFNEYMFYSKERISIYSPHILKGNKNVTSILLTEEQKKFDLSDFQYTKNHKNNNDIFLKTLEKRIGEMNALIEKNINIENYKNIFGFCKNKNNNNYYLYSVIDEDIIKNKLKENDLEFLKKNLIMNESQINTRSSVMEIYDKNMEYLKGLTFEELILFIILDRLKHQYEILPRVLFYENYMTIFGGIIEPLGKTGYNEIDYVIYSKNNHQYSDDSPLIIQNYYSYNKEETDLQFEIKKDTLYFFELKSSSFYINNDFFEKTFNKCIEFTNLYESKNMINKNIKKEIMLIYDNKSDYSLPLTYEKKIKDFLQNNKNYSFNIVYSIKTYAHFSHSLAIKKYDEIKKENELLDTKIKIIEKEKNEQSNKINEQGNKIENLEKDKNEQSNQINEQGNKIENLEKEKIELLSKIINLESELEKLKLQVNEMNKQN